MPSLVHRSTDRGVRFRSPAVRVYRRSCQAPAAGGRPRFGRRRRDPRLAARRMHWGSNGELSTLTVMFELGAGPGLAERLRPEQAIQQVSIGDGLILTQPVRADRPLGVVQAELFRGTVGRVRPLIRSGPDREGFEATAYGPEIRLKNKVVGGQWCKAVDRDDAELAGSAVAADARRDAVISTDLPVIFNEGGAPNATREDFRLASIHDHPSADVAHNQCKVFESPGRKVNDEGGQVEAVYWDAFSALRSLVEFVDDYDVISPATEWSAIRALLGEVPIGEVVVEGMNLLQAARVILLPVGFGFALEPWADDVRWAGPVAPTDTDKHRLTVFRLRGSSRRRCPRLAPVVGGNARADSLAGQRAQVQRLEFARDARDLANCVTVIGDARRRQVVLEFNSDAEARDLHPFWNTDAHDLADWANGDDVVDPRSNPPWTQVNQETFFKRYNHGADHQLYKHVFRTFVWNEDAALRPVVAAAPDLNELGIGDGANWVRRPRPVGRTFLYDEAEARVRTYPALVQLGIEGDEDSWIDIAATPLLDRAGLIIARQTLHDWYPYDRNDVPKDLRDAYGSGGSTPVSYLTALHNALADNSGPKLCLRLVGSVECDEVAKADAERTADSPWPYAAERIVRAEGRFAWRDVAADPFTLSSERYDVRDDREDAAAYAAAVCAASEHCIGRGTVVLRGVVRAFRPGDSVPHTQGRRIDLGLGGRGSGIGPQVTAVNYDFQEGAGKTELVLASPGRE